MSDSRKALRDLASGTFGNLRTLSAAQEAALDMQRKIDKLTAFRLLGNDRLSRIARGLPSPAMEKAIAIASGKLTGLDNAFAQGSLLDRTQHDTFRLYDSLEKYGAMRSSVEAAIGKINALETTGFGRAHDAAAKLALVGGHRFGSGLDERIAESIRRINEPYVALTARQEALLGIDRDAVGALARTRHWADTLTGSTARDYAAILGTGDRYRKEFEALNLAAGSIASATNGFGGNSLAAIATSRSAELAGLTVTATKMSLFAGSLDVLGPGAGGNHAAYNALLGGYATPAMLDRPYWRDSRERARYYRDQDVDEGLIDADNASTVAVLIDSGVVEGKRTRAGTMTAVVEAGPVRVRIMASRPKIGAFGAIDSFESALRTFVAVKLLAAQGPNWFKQRVPGDVVGRAKDRRREAMRAGEIALDLIHYIDLGDMIAVITRKDNWTELFEAVFDRAEWLKVDLERLNASRRPTMHSRPVDPVQLCEIVLTIRRLVGWIEREGQWDSGWDDDV
ncbi:MAG: hypothetical protein EOP62_12165 [Sphingomonadales bacterium]|nr:MAG: hypothetical protein EOP62_12165 [Sphingomonadales bacterium]